MRGIWDDGGRRQGGAMDAPSPLPPGEGQGEGVSSRLYRRRMARATHPHPTLSRGERAFATRPPRRGAPTDPPQMRSSAALAVASSAVRATPARDWTASE